MRIAVLGGSFNPLHIGHAMLCDAVCKELGFDKVLLVPTCNPPHKIIKSNVTAQERLEMVKAFCEAEGTGRFLAESCEIDRGGISYTSDTLEFINKIYKDILSEKPYFIMGEEIAAEFEKWKSPEHIIEMCSLIISRRHPNMNNIDDAKYSNEPSAHYAGEFKVAFNPENFKFSFVRLENPRFPVSSTEIRARIAEGKSWKYMVPETIAEYIIKNQLYLVNS